MLQNFSPGPVYRLSADDQLPYICTEMNKLCALYNYYYTDRVPRRNIWNRAREKIDILYHLYS